MKQFKLIVVLAALCSLALGQGGATGGGTGSGTGVVSIQPPPPQETLTVTVTGAGSVVGSPNGIGNMPIACPSSCQANYLSGSTVTLTETPGSGQTFVGWSGDCLSAGTSTTCVLSVANAALNVTATFTSSSGGGGCGGTGGGPCTYNARHDGCVSPTLTPGLCPNPGATGTSGSTLTFQLGNSDPLPFFPINDASHRGDQNNCWIDPDFRTYECFVTDQSHMANTTSVHQLGDGGDHDAFTTSGSMLTFSNTGGVNEFAYINKASFLAHTCTTSGPNKCFTTSLIRGAQCAPSCSNRQVDTNAGMVFSHNPADSGYTLFEVSIPVATKDVIDPVGDVIQTRATYVDWTKDIASGGTVDCKVLPPDYVETWTGSTSVGLNGSLTLAAGGGGSWATRDWNTGGGGAVNNNTFILPVNHNPQLTITNITTIGFPLRAVITYSTNYTFTHTGGSIPISQVNPSSYNGVWVVDSFTPYSAGSGTVTVLLAPGVGGTYVSHGKIGYANAMFQATTAGVDNGPEPDWLSFCGAQGTTCSSGSAVWTNISNVTGQGPGFDVLNYRPGIGCKRVNTRTHFTFNGTNNTEPSGLWKTDDAFTCFRMNGSSCGTGGTVNPDDSFTLHAATQLLDDRYSTFGPTGAGTVNKNYVGGSGDQTMAAKPNGSCLNGASHLDLPGGAINTALWNATTGYAKGKYVFWTDNIFYKALKTTTCSVGAPCTNPPADPTDWQVANAYCYNYIMDWATNTVRPCIQLGPNNGCDAHEARGILYIYKGGKYANHFPGKPNCQNTTDPGCTYIGQPNPGNQLLPTAICSDGHPSYQNVGSQDLQPLFRPDVSVPSWGGSSITAPCSGNNVNNCSFYTCAGYSEEVAFLNVATAPAGTPQTLWRFTSNYNTASSQFFSVQNAIGVVSQQGDMLAFSTDAMGTRGDISGATTCVNNKRGQYQPVDSQVIALNDYVFPVGSNPNKSIYQVTALGAGCVGTCGERGIPDWTTCQTLNSTCSDGNNNVFTNRGPNSCRGDIVLVDLLTAGTN